MIWSVKSSVPDIINTELTVTHKIRKKTEILSMYWIFPPPPILRKTYMNLNE